MNVPDHYFFNVALHSALLSVVVFVCLFLVRKPHRRAIASLVGLLSIAILPWFSAMWPQDGMAGRGMTPAASSGDTLLPAWTVIRIPLPEKPLATVEAPRGLPSPALADSGTVMFIGWAAGAGFLLTALGLSLVGVARWRRTLRAPDESEWQAIRELVPEAPARGCFLVSGPGGSPCAAGFFKPVIVIPRLLFAPESNRELRWSLLHELRHWRGGDSIWTIILEFVRVVHWWNPFVHLLISHWKIARECVCDLAAGEGDRASYGKFLVAMAAKPRCRNSLAVAMVRPRRLRVLRSRIVALLDAAPGNTTPFEKGVLFGTCALLLGAASLVSGMRIDGGSPPSSARGGSGAAMAAEENPVPAAPGSRRYLQVKLSTKVLVAGVDLAKEKRILTEGDLQKILRTAGMRKDAKLFALPEVTARSGETARLEIVREESVSDPREERDWNSHRTGRFAGWSLHFTTSYSGKFGLALHAGYGFVPGAHFSPDSAVPSLLDEGSDIDWLRLVQRSAESRGDLNNGETLVTSLGEVETGKFAAIFVTVRATDATGRPAESFEEASLREPRSLSGRLRYRGTVVERAEFEGFEVIGGLQTPGYSFYITRAHWEEMKDRLGGEELPAVEAPAGKSLRPWEGVKGVSFTGKILERELFHGHNQIEISLDCRFSANGEDSPDNARASKVEVSSGLVHLFKLEPEAPGATRFLFLEVEQVE